MATRDHELFERSKKIVPGGVHSPVRSFKGLEMPPVFFERAQGATLYDTDGKDYIDFCMSFGPMILGHRHPQVEENIQQALKRGWSYGACEPYSLALAEFLIEHLDHIDQLRFVNSGTEAVMTAVRIARGFTGKNKIVKFDGCYHGHLDSMLIKAGSGLAGSAEASSAGVPAGVASDTLIVELNDLEALKKCLQEHKDDLAAILIEPLPANNGLLIQDHHFLKELRALADQYQTLLIFDEVISGFRVSFGGMAQLSGVTPDLVTYGKIIGGGMPVGAVAGKAEVMSCLAPQGAVYQAGTLSANPLAMVAGLSTLQYLAGDEGEELYQQIESNKNRIVSLFQSWFRDFQNGRFAENKITHFQSLFWISTQENIKRPSEIPAHQAEYFAPAFKELLSRGIYLAPNAYEVGFVSAAHDYQVCDELERRLS